MKYLETELFRAAKIGGLSIVIEIINSRQASNAHMESALCTAASFGHPRVVAALLQKELGMDAKNRALVAAARSGRARCAALLLDAGADVNSGGGEALLEVIYWSRDYETVAVLLKHGADVHARNDEPLRMAAVRGRPDIMELLLDHGADIKKAIDDPGLRGWLGRVAEPDVTALLETPPSFEFETPWAVRTATAYPKAGISLTKIFDFRAREVVTRSEEGYICVQPFSSVSPRRVEAAAEALREFRRKGSPASRPQ